MTRHQTTLTELARLGFANLGEAAELLDALSGVQSAEVFLQHASATANPDLALRQLVSLVRSAQPAVMPLLQDYSAAGRLIRVLGASTGLGEFLHRHPEELGCLREPLTAPPGRETYIADLLDSVSAVDGVSALTEDDGWRALRVRYRRHLTSLTAWDLAQRDALAGIDVVAAALADLAAAALEAGLAVARGSIPFPADQIASTSLAIIGMGKSGARELNYVSDVDVIFVAEARDELPSEKALQIATKLAMATMRAVHDYASEPDLWEVDANLRPEGKDGALVRTLESHKAYYDRWAKSWEFQALLKARPLAGDLDLGARYVDAISPLVWASAARENFVGSVQRMRERVTANIPAAELEYQLKLGPGGLRDIEFTIQLLQLVHGNADDTVRQAGTLPALVALAEGGYIGRVESAQFQRDYRFLRLLEHRLQLSRLRRTHLMPADPDGMRVLARASGIATSASELEQEWSRTKVAVRTLHERLFYRPLLSAVAALREDEVSLTSSQAEARLFAIGFHDPKGALGHIQALTSGVSRRSSIQRTLLPVMLQWFSEGADPDYGLLAFRRLSEALGESYWFLRMLRDSSGAASRLTSVLSSARFVGMLFERNPEAAAWFEDDDDLVPRGLDALLEEARATIARHDDAEAAAGALRSARRREVLRVSVAAILGLIDVETVGFALTDITTTMITGALELARRGEEGFEFGVIALGRYGGRELGFGSDADVVYVYRPTTAEATTAQSRAEGVVSRLVKYCEDLSLPLDLDIDLRPEGKNGPVVRSLDSYRAYYARWSLTWEAQALLRAHGAAGDAPLLRAFEHLADETRYPAAIEDRYVREVRRIKARVESERLPQAADPARHLKLGRGSLSDVEWCVQLIQLRHAAAHPSLRTTSTLKALAAAEHAGFLTQQEAQDLRAAWIFASRVRSAMTLWMVRTTDVLPVDRPQLEGIARLMEYPPGSASTLEDDYLRVTRHARRVFEKRFYGDLAGT